MWALLWPAMLSSQQVVAEVNGEKITLRQLEAELGPLMRPLEEQIRRLREAVLNRLIDNALIRQAAAREGVSLQEFVSRYVEHASVSQQEVDDEYARNKQRFAGTLEPEAKYRIKRTLEDNRRADAFRRLLERLRSQAEVRNFLLEVEPGEIESASKAGPSAGSPNASITILEFFDFECPFSRQGTERVRALAARYPEQIRFVVRHLPLDRHSHAFDAAKAAVCAEAQGRFWEFLERAMRQGADLSRPGLLAIARELRLGEEQFWDCVSWAAAAERVRADIEVARRLRVDRTPTFFVNSRRVFTVEQVERAVEELIAKGWP
jgi:predicted DsbA family dithiol-disulfide isomerase